MIVETKKGKLPVRYGMNALALFSDLTDKSMNEVMECLGDLGSMKISEVLAFIYVGFVNGAKFKGEECAIKGIDEIGYMLDEDSDLINKVTKIFVSDSSTDEEEGDSKKK